MNNSVETTVYFVRHGQTAANATGVIQGQTDVLLDETGLAQAKLVGARLKKHHFDAIYSSDLTRAMVTAREIADGREIIATPQLREWHLGHWQGKNIEQIKIDYPEEYRKLSSDAADCTIQDGESSAEFQQRASGFMQFVAENHPGETVLAVSHGGFMVKALKHVLELDSLKRRPRADNTSIAIFKTADRGKNWQLVSWNDTAHLDSEALDDV